MGKLTLDELKKLREKMKSEMDRRDSADKSVTILVGMGTCGIAAGARETLQAFVDGVEKMGLSNILIKPTGCMGSCSVEPTVEVVMAGMPDVLYGKVNAETARKILERHVVGKQLLNNLIFDKPAADIVKHGGK